MRAHTDILRDLYGYVRNELPDGERDLIRTHLEGCARCRRALEELTATLEALEPLLTSPSAGKDEATWEKFADGVMAEVYTRPAPVHDRRWRDSIGEIVTARRRWILAGGAAALAVGIVMLLAPPPQDPEPGAAPAATAAVTPDDPVDSYLRRSTSLLVSLTSAPPEALTAEDLSLERAVSRELVNQARAIDGTTVDPRSARVIADMQKVLIELANLHESEPFPQVEMVLHGIRSKNLLFRVRMAGAVRDSVRLLQAAMMDDRE